MKPGHDIRSIDPRHPDPALIAMAGGVIQSGGVVIFPTACLYGLAADAFNRSAVEKIFRMKRRAPENPLLLLIPDQEALNRLAAEIPTTAVRIMERFWPGMVTLVFTAVETVPVYLTAGSGKIGVRLPAHPVARALAGAVRRPITGTSANISGRPGFEIAEGLPDVLAEPPDLILDAGRLKGGPGSTVVDVTLYPPRILREGSVPAADVLAVLND
jgi:L-threonylcarbamoyladenylate synthase